MKKDDEIRHSGSEKNSIVQSIFKEVYGEDAPPEEVVPFSFITRNDLVNAADALRLDEQKTLLDLACGAGGPGLWISRRTGARVIGVDHSCNAVVKADKRICEFALMGKAMFAVGDAELIGVKSGAIDGVMSFDALWAPKDKEAVFREIYRVLRFGGRCVFTTWEDGFTDYRKMIVEAGFTIETWYETANWEVYQRNVYYRWIESESLLIQEIGKDATGLLMDEARFMTACLDTGVDRLSQLRRVFICLSKG